MIQTSTLLPRNWSEKPATCVGNIVVDVMREISHETKKNRQLQVAENLVEDATL